MGWMKAIYTDVEELNENVLDIYAENQITDPMDAIGPLKDYLRDTGWKTPTEMLELSQRTAKYLASLHNKDSLSMDADSAMQLLELMEALRINSSDVFPAHGTLVVEL